MTDIEQLRVERDVLAATIADAEAELTAAGIPAEDRHAGLTLAGRVQRLAEGRERAKAACVALRAALEPFDTGADIEFCADDDVIWFDASNHAPAHLLKRVHRVLAAPDPGADILAVGRAVTAALQEHAEFNLALAKILRARFPEWDGKVESDDLDHFKGIVERTGTALARAKALGWTELLAGGEKPCES